MRLTHFNFAHWIRIIYGQNNSVTNYSCFALNQMFQIQLSVSWLNNVKKGQYLEQSTFQFLREVA